MVRTRIAPSPTGKDVHVGTVTTGLMNYAWAKKNNGQFVIRIEDTDQSRIVPGGEKKMLDTLNKIGLVADESPIVGGQYASYRQSERLSIYKKYAQELIDKGAAYFCTCTPVRLDEMRKKQQAEKKVPKYDRFCLHRQEEIKKEIASGKKYVIRLLMPEKDIIFDDIVRGKITINGTNLDDQVLLKSDGFPTYHLAVVVDDYLMKITHIIRGEEWMPSTPKHIVLYQAFGWELPIFAHVSLLRNKDKSKLSKRKNPVWTSDYLEQGIIPEALLNYLALMGWSHPEGKDIFTLDEYIKLFNIKDLQTTAPVFDPVKLEWMNGMYIREMRMENLELRISQYVGDKYSRNLIKKTIPIIRERIKKFSEYLPLCEFFFQSPTIYEVPLENKNNFFKNVYEKLSTISDWRALVIGENLVNLAKEINVKNSEFFMLLRVAITGKKISPPLNDSMEILGKDECLNRIKKLS